jgi:hypothetical protein
MDFPAFFVVIGLNYFNFVERHQCQHGVSTKKNRLRYA